jgi:UDP-2,3-diacylglucosamine hydrolase
VAHYFASDVHLRADQPQRDRRFRAFVGRLTPADTLVIVGDLCDFWMGARQREAEMAAYPSLWALAEFRRGGGSLEIMAGNHDAWLGPFYRRHLGARLVAEPYDLTVHGLRLHLVHGHLLGARRRWKSWMESRAFYRLFGLLPGPIAGPLDRVLAWKNQRGLLDDEERHLRVYRSHAAACRDRADLVVIGHVHRPVDEAEAAPRLIVLGGWQDRSSYLRINETGATFHVEANPERVDQPGSAPNRGGGIRNSTREAEAR